MDTLEIDVRRVKRLPTRTLGVLSMGGKDFCFTLEDAVREPGVKVYGQTAIPSGRYKITLENSPKYGPFTLTINDVPNFSYIRIHAGNTEVDTEGCLLVGLEANLDGTIKGGTSRPAVVKLQAVIRAALDSGLEVWITIH